MWYAVLLERKYPKIGFRGLISAEAPKNHYKALPHPSNKPKQVKRELIELKVLLLFFTREANKSSY